MRERLLGDDIMDPNNLDDQGLYPEQLEMMSEVFKEYALYCQVRATYLRNKQPGYAEWCDEIYMRLPEYAKWR